MAAAEHRAARSTELMNDHSDLVHHATRAQHSDTQKYSQAMLENGPDVYVDAAELQH